MSCISNTIASITCNNSCFRVLYCYSQTSCFTFYYYMYQDGIICAIILNSLNLCDAFGNMVDAKFLLESTHFALIPTNYWIINWFHHLIGFFKNKFSDNFMSEPFILLGLYSLYKNNRIKAISPQNFKTFLWITF